MEKKGTIIAVGGTKGGSGKTTISINLAIWLFNKGFKVLVIDADHQGSARDYTSVRSALNEESGTGYTLSLLTGENLYHQALNFAHVYDFVIIDTHGGDDEAHKKAMAACNIYLLPMEPSAIDFWTISLVCTRFTEIRAVQVTPAIGYTFLSQADYSSQENRETAAGLQELTAFKYVDAPIQRRKAIRKAAALGLSVAEYIDDKGNPVDKTAVEDFDKLFNEILKTVINEQVGS